MAFRWLGATATGGVLRVQGNPGDPSAKTRINWGDGTSQVLSNNVDTDGDGVFDSVEVAHSWATSGRYNIRINGDSAQVAVYADAVSGLRINTRSGDDLLIGSAFNDRLGGANGANFIDGGGGSDIIVGTALVSGDRGDIVFGGTGNDMIRYQNCPSADVLNGEDGSDYIHGGSGIDTLSGGAGADRLVGGYSSDVIEGGSGSDVLWGDDTRAGLNAQAADRFVFGLDAADGTRDVIMDFSTIEGDILDLSSFEGVFTFVGGNAFSGAGMEVRTVVGADRLFVLVDLDGNRAAELSMLLLDVTILTTADFSL